MYYIMCIWNLRLKAGHELLGQKIAPVVKYSVDIAVALMAPFL